MPKSNERVIFWRDESEHLKYTIYNIERNLFVTNPSKEERDVDVQAETTSACMGRVTTAWYVAAGRVDLTISGETISAEAVPSHF
jgi:hypothetical protein